MNKKLLSIKKMHIKKVFFPLLIITNLINAKILEFPNIKIFKKIPSDTQKRLSSYPYISGDTFRSFCDFVIDKTNRCIDPKGIKDGDTIFIANHKPFLDFFFEEVHPKIKTNYILVTHNHDNSEFNSYEKYLEEPRLIAWFGVNLTIIHKKAFPIPIGLANRYWGHGNTRVIDQTIKNLPLKKDILMYMNFAIGTNKKKREPIFNALASKKFCHIATNRKFHDFILDLAKSKFVISPPGNGIDCHRTWESLYLGAIPIIETSKLDPVFKDLPIIIIKDWNNITAEFLKQKYEKISFKTYNMEKIFANYWFEQINKYKKKAIIKANKNIQKHFPVNFNKSMSRNKHYNQEVGEKDNNWKKLEYLFEENIRKNPQYSNTPKIPKIIHQIWLGNKGKLPEKYKHFQKTWLENHPEWEYRLWTEKEIDAFGLKNRKHYDETRNYGVKADIARYEILYRFGGLYIDTDFECLKPFDIIHHVCDFYAGAEYGKDAAMLNGIIGASAKHPILLECINNIKTKKPGNEGYNAITNRTGPHYLTRCFFKVMSTYSGPSIVFPVTYFYPWPHYVKGESLEQISKLIAPESFAIHHWFMAWNK